MSNKTTLEQQKLKRTVAKRACLNCRSKKIKCDGEVVVFLEGKNQCTNCLLSNIDGCIFLPSKRGGRKPKTKKVNKSGPNSLKLKKNTDNHSIDKINIIDNLQVFHENKILPNGVVVNSQSPVVVYNSRPYQHIGPPFLPNNLHMFKHAPPHLQQQMMPPMVYNNMVPMYPNIHPSDFQIYQPNNMVYNALPNHFYMNPDIRNAQYHPPNNIKDQGLNPRKFSNVPSETSLSSRENTRIDRNTAIDSNINSNFQLPSMHNALSAQQSHYWNIPNNKPQSLPQHGMFLNPRVPNKHPQIQGFNPDVLTPINNVKFLKNTPSANSITNFSSKTLTPQLPTNQNNPVKTKFGMIGEASKSQADKPKQTK